jgi:hypothetical protein
MPQPGSWTAVVAMTILLLPGCAPKIAGPSTTAPSPGYTRVEAATQEAWDAAVDFLIDNGIGFEYISNDLQLANIKVVLSEGATLIRGTGIVQPDTMAQHFADCGTIGGRLPLAGMGELIADVAVRVRSDPSGQPLVKVVMPRVRMTYNMKQYTCVSKGLFEERARGEIQRRLKPIMLIR